MEGDIPKIELFSANCGLESAKGFCDAIDILESGLTDLAGCVNCAAIGNKVLWDGNCRAINSVWNCRF